MPLNHDAALTIRQLEMFFDGHVSYRAIDGWVRRGKLTPVGRNASGQLLLRLGDALQVEAAAFTAKRGRPRTIRPPQLSTAQHL